MARMVRVRNQRAHARGLEHARARRRRRITSRSAGAIRMRPGSSPPRPKSSTAWNGSCAASRWSSEANWRALEIGCGPGRLMRPMSRHFVEIHGVDVSDEMIALAKEKLRDIPNAHRASHRWRQPPAVRRRNLRLRLFLRGLPTHPQPGGGVSVSAGDPARAQAGRPGAAAIQRTGAWRGRPLRHLVRRAIFFQRHSGIYAGSRFSGARAGGRFHAIHVDHLAQARLWLACGSGTTCPALGDSPRKTQPRKIQPASAASPTPAARNQWRLAAAAGPPSLSGSRIFPPMPGCITCASSWAIRSAPSTTSGLRTPWDCSR